MPSEFPKLTEQERALRSSRGTVVAFVLAMLAVFVSLALAWTAYFGWRDQPVELDLAAVAAIPTGVTIRLAGKYLYLDTHSYARGETEDEDERCSLKMNPITCAAPDFYADLVESEPGKYEVAHIYTHLSQPDDDVLGLFGYVDFCGGLQAEPLTSFPYEISDLSQQIVVNTVETDGSVVATFGGTAYQLLPGQSWVKRSVRTDLTCGTVTKEEWVTNYGWIEEEKIGWNLY